MLLSQGFLLGILTARELNDDLFFVARQERPQNDQLFDNSGANLIARPSVIVGRRILALATTPLLKTFLDHLEGKQADESFAERARRDLERSLGDYAPNVWVTHVEGPNAAGLRAANEEGEWLNATRPSCSLHRGGEPCADLFRCWP